MKLFSTVKNELLFSNILPGADRKKVQAQITKDNWKFVIIWSVTQIVYWAFCLFMSLSDSTYARCRAVYLGALIICLFTLAAALIVAPKAPDLTWLLALAVDVVLLGSGIWISIFQLQHEGRTILLFASVLMVPVMFISHTVFSICLLLLNILTFLFVIPPFLRPEAFNWALTNLIIFSSAGILLGHFVNKARFERYVFAESVSELADLQARYAYYDQMTGLKNRRAYAEKLEQLSKEASERYCMVMIDINGLKEANDNLGHDAGDELIIGTARCLCQGFQGTDLIYRMGGDEFCVIMTGTKAEAENCVEQTEKTAADWNGNLIKGISISCGVASSEEASDPELIVKMADERMYEAKRQYYLASGKSRRS